jgi:hypothetical protein
LDANQERLCFANGTCSDRIVACNGRLVTTEFGARYELQEDPNNPLANRGDLAAASVFAWNKPALLSAQAHQDQDDYSEHNHEGVSTLPDAESQFVCPLFHTFKDVCEPTEASRSAQASLKRGRKSPRKQRMRKLRDATRAWQSSLWAPSSVMQLLPIMHTAL